MLSESSLSPASTRGANPTLPPTFAASRLRVISEMRSASASGSTCLEEVGDDRVEVQPAGFRHSQVAVVDHDVAAFERAFDCAFAALERVDA